MEKLPKNFDKNSDGWVKCSEMLPNESRLYLTFFDGRVDIQYYKSESKRFNHPYLETITTTHWRELPAPPKDQLTKKIKQLWEISLQTEEVAAYIQWQYLL